MARTLGETEPVVMVIDMGGEVRREEVRGGRDMRGTIDMRREI